MAGNTLTFGGSTKLTNTNNLTAATSFAGLTFNAGSGAFVLGGNSITLNGNIDNNGTNATVQTINFDIALAKNAQTGVLRIANSFALGSTAGGTILLAGNALELSNNISVGAEALSIAGIGVANGGALRNIHGTNSHGGLLTLTAATRINSDTGLLTLTNTGTITGAGFGLTLGGAGNITLNSIIGTTTGTLTKDGTGILTLSSSNSFSGGTTVREGELHVNSSGVLGTGSVSLTGTNPISLAALHYSNSATPLAIGALTLNGNASVALQAPSSSVLSSGAIAVNSTNNFISLGGVWSLGTDTLISGTSLSFGGGSSIFLTGTTLNNGTLGLGSTTNIGRTSFSFGTNATSFYVTTAWLNFDVLWSGAQNNLWNTNATNWQVAANGLNLSGTNIAFATDDNVYFGNAATSNAITVDAGGVQAAQMYVTNSAGAVTFNGGNLAAHNLFKSGSGNLTISNSLALIGDDAAGPNSGVFSNTGSGNVTLSGVFSEGSLVQSGSGTLTLTSSNTFAGPVTIAGGVLSANNLADAGSASSIGTASSLTLSNNGVLRYTGSTVPSTAMSTWRAQAVSGSPTAPRRSPSPA